MPQVIFPATFDLANLNGLNGFVLNGQQAADSSGYSVSTAGDVNGDGIADLLIGAPYAANFGPGRSYVVFGKSGLGASGVLNLATLDGTNGFVMNGQQAHDNSGFSVSAAGDVNGDGVGDLLIGAYGANSNTGSSYLVFGTSRLGKSGVLNLGALNGVNGLMLNGQADNDLSGFSVSAAGDVNGDGVSDLLIGAPQVYSGNEAGRTYVVFGKSGIGTNAVFNLSALNGTNGFVMNGQINDASGLSVSTAGDVNGDGIGDLLIGSPGPAPYPNSVTGRSYMVFGKSSIGSNNGVLNLDTFDGTNGVVLNGEQIGDASGVSVSGAGDVNGDGVKDLVIGAYHANSGAGRSYVVFGNSGIGGNGLLNLGTLDGVNGFVMRGQQAGDRSGFSVSAAGDVNGDGVEDLLIGAYYANTQAGCSYVVFGKSDIGGNGLLNLGALDGTNGFILNGQAGDWSGYSVSAAGDVNDDGIGDLLIGAPYLNVVGAGRSYVVFGDNATFVLHQNQLTIAQGQTHILDSTNLNASSYRWPYHSLSFQVSNIQLGYFASLNNPDISITIFTQNQINQGQIAFVYTGSYPQAPSYDITVSSPGLAISSPSSATITLVDNSSESKPSAATIVGGTMAGLLGASAILGLAAFYFRTKAKEELDKAIETNGSGLAQQSGFRKKVFYPIAKKIYEQIKISGFLGHLSKQTAESFVVAIQTLVEELQKQGVDLDLEKTSPEYQQNLFNEVSKQIRLHTLPKHDGCATTAARFCRFFKAETTPVEIEDKANAIAVSVQKELSVRAPLLSYDSQQDEVEFSQKKSDGVITGVTQTGSLAQTSPTSAASYADHSSYSSKLPPSTEDDGETDKFISALKLSSHEKQKNDLPKNDSSQTRLTI